MDIFQAETHLSFNRINETCAMNYSCIPYKHLISNQRITPNEPRSFSIKALVGYHALFMPFSKVHSTLTSIYKLYRVNFTSRLGQHSCIVFMHFVEIKYIHVLHQKAHLDES